MKRTPYGIPGDGGLDMVRMRGWGLRLMHEADRQAEIEAVEADLEDLDPDDPENEALIELLQDVIADLEAGHVRARVPDYDPADEVANKIGHENPIQWVRRQDAERKRTGRRLAWRR